MPLQSSLKLKVSRSLLLPCSQQRKSSGPPHKPKMKKHGTFVNCVVTDNKATGSLWKWFTHESSNYRQ